MSNEQEGEEDPILEQFKEQIARDPEFFVARDPEFFEKLTRYVVKKGFEALKATALDLYDRFYDAMRDDREWTGIWLTSVFTDTLALLGSAETFEDFQARLRKVNRILSEAEAETILRKKEEEKGDQE